MKSWFHRLCRDSGLMIHQIVKPLRSGGRLARRTTTVEEKNISGTVTLRRTTIEEIEFRPDDSHRPA